MIRRFWWVFPVMAVLGLVGGLLVAGIITFLMPSTYQSEAVIELRQMMPALAENPRNASVPPDDETPGHLVGPLKDIVSKAILTKVVDKLQLSREWSTDQSGAVALLEKSLTVRNLRGTDLVSIRVRSTDKIQARAIAAETVSIYIDDTARLRTTVREAQMKDLDVQISEFEQRVEERVKVMRMVPAPESGNPPLTGEIQAGGGLDYIDAKREMDRDKETLRSLRLQRTEAVLRGKLQDESVLIHEEPQAARKPVSPNVPLNLVLGMGLGFLASPLLSLALIRVLAKKSDGAAR